MSDHVTAKRVGRPVNPCVRKWVNPIPLSDHTELTTPIITKRLDHAVTRVIRLGDGGGGC